MTAALAPRRHASRPAAPSAGWPLLRPEDLADPAQFLTLRNVPVFVTHEALDAPGPSREPRRAAVDRPTLERLARQSNARANGRPLHYAKHPAVAVAHRPAKPSRSPRPLVSEAREVLALTLETGCTVENAREILEARHYGKTSGTAPSGRMSPADFGAVVALTTRTGCSIAEAKARLRLN